jgi:hypothetical protein
MRNLVIIPCFRGFSYLIPLTCKLFNLYLYTEYHDVKARRLSLDAINTYHKLAQLASDSTQFDNVLQSARTHVAETLQKWSKSEYEHNLAQLSPDFSLFHLGYEEVNKSYKQNMTNHILEEWILQELTQNQIRKESSDDFLNDFLPHPKEYSEEDETIKMISWFSIVNINNNIFYFFAFFKKTF